MHKGGLAPPLVTAGHLGFSLHIIFVRKRCLRVTFPKSLRNLPTFSRIVNAKQIWNTSRFISHQASGLTSRRANFWNPTSSTVISGWERSRRRSVWTWNTDLLVALAHFYSHFVTCHRLFSAKKNNEKMKVEGWKKRLFVSLQRNPVTQDDDPERLRRTGHNRGARSE